MLRQLMMVVVLLSGTAFYSGCRSCSSCHDYDRPVADCECGTCGCGRAGSAFSGCQGGTCGRTGCGPNGCGPADDHFEQGYAE